MNTDAADQVVDEDADLDTAEDGSRITDAHHKLDAERQRDERGRFVAEDEAEEAEGEEAEGEAEAEAEPASVPAAKPKKGAEAEEESEEETDEGTDADERREGEEEEAGEEGAPKPNRMSRRIATLAEKNRATEQRLRQVEAELAAERVRATQTTQKSEIEVLNEAQNTLYEEVEKARADGDTKTAAKLQREIDTNNRRITMLESEPRVVARTAAAVESTKFNDMLAQVEQRIPELDQTSDAFDQVAAREMEFQIQAYERMGMKSSAALQRATLLLYGVDMSKPSQAATEAAAPAPAKKPLVKPTNVQRNLEASKRVVPKPAATAPEIEEGRINVAELTDEEFDALPESKLDELGGNAVRSGRRR